VVLTTLCGTNLVDVRGQTCPCAPAGLTLVVCDVAIDVAAASAIALVVVVGGGSFKFGRGGMWAVHGALPGGFFVFSVVLRLAFARSLAMLLTGVVVGITGKLYIIVRCWVANLWEHGWLGANCGCGSNYVVRT
jgi:hypothetical protein